MNIEKRERIIKACCKSNGVAYVPLGQRASVPVGTYREQWTQAYRDARFRRGHSENVWDALAIAYREQDTVRQLYADSWMIVNGLERSSYQTHAGRYPNHTMFFRAWYTKGQANEKVPKL